MQIETRKARRRLSRYGLDCFFAVWLLYVLSTGNLIPPALAELIHPSAPVVASVEPLGAPYHDDTVSDPRPDA